MRCNPCYGQSWICELCPHKKEGMKRLDEYSEKLAAKIAQIVSDHIKEAVEKAAKQRHQETKKD